MISTSYGNRSLEATLGAVKMTAAYDSAIAKSVAYITSIRGQLPGFAKRAGETADLDAIQAAAGHIRAGFTDVLIFGTGGSSLGAQAAAALARYLSHPSPCRLHFPDSLDAYEMDRLLKMLDPAETHILAISKSGSTAETLAQLLVSRAWLEAGRGQAGLADCFTFITEPGPRPLRTYAEKLGSAIIDHPTDVGGRFSVLTAVGMLPAAIAGLDVSAFRGGASAELDATLSAPDDSIAVSGAALQQAAADLRGHSMTVVMAYADALRAFTRWHGQLWAESLGKDGRGTTPVRAVGPVDQHSQLQLFQDGPDDKFYTFIEVPSLGLGPVVPAAEASAYGLDYMAGKTIGDTVACQAKATADTLRQAGRLVRTLSLEAYDERCLGALFLSFMMETVVAAHLLEVNAFDQPGVEGSKNLTRRYLSDL